MPRSLTTEELERICVSVRDTLQTGSLAERRDACGILLGLYGLRIQEICNANRNDLQLGNDGQYWLRVRTLKGGRYRDIPVEKNLAEQVRTLRHKNASGPLLEVDGGGRLAQRNLRRRWHQVRTAAGVAHARFHDLRHTAAMKAWERSGKNFFVVSTLLGHKKLENTRVYLATAGAITEAVIPFEVPEVRAALQVDRARPPKRIASK